MALFCADLIRLPASRCRYCRDLTPEFSKAAESLAPLIPFYNVDCDAEENRPLCGRYGVKGFPTIKVRVCFAAVSMLGSSHSFLPGLPERQ